MDVCSFGGMGWLPMWATGLLFLSLLRSTRADVGPSVSEHWPGCVLHDKAPDSPESIRVDVREFIKHPDHVRHRVIEYKSNKVIGMYMREHPHESGEMVEEVQSGSQAYHAGVQKGWIITEINGMKVNQDWSLRDVALNVKKAQTAGPTLKVKYDVRAAVDCLHASCNSSDRLPAVSSDACAIACERRSSCQFWSIHHEAPGFKMCMLHGHSMSFVSAPGFSGGSRDCFPVPKMSKAVTWPKCAIYNADVKHGNPVFADVRQFIVYNSDQNRHKDLIFKSGSTLGMMFREQPHHLGELVADVIPGSQAAVLGVRAGWIVKEVNGAPFRKGETLIDISKDFEVAKHKFDTLTVKFDVKSHSDCTKGYCGYSDKFPASAPKVCADACAQVPECAVWYFGMDEEDTMCYFRSDWAGLRAEHGSIAGASDCSPSAIWHHFIFVGCFVFLTSTFIVYRLIKKWLYGGSFFFWKDKKLLD